MRWKKSIAAFLFYLASAVSFLCVLLKFKWISAPVASSTLRLGLVAHSLALPFFFLEKSIDLFGSGGEYFFCLSWLLALSFALFGRKFDYPIVGALLCPAAALFLLSSSLLVHFHETDIASDAPFMIVSVHVLPALLAEFCLFLAFVVSAVYLLQSRRLKHKNGAALPFESPALH